MEFKKNRLIVILPMLFPDINDHPPVIGQH